MVVLKWILEEYSMKVWSGFIRLRMEVNDILLRKWL
jgi:hypothetical protein